ncbi:VanZ family protein [Lacticaseibacillus pabuli]|uniref:VanZ family protein n=1 Tax=Lacticaseibacillus pabuli TaxID=3025672 RepID=A0ABY7WQF0_9LACO|nr:VanZ family protein [Lacticaseibacillus sp. KACC 23028]WDF81881.1 VanZ family protein [Lacticaseibacillus sp. KACC 23028]
MKVIKKYRWLLLALLVLAVLFVSSSMTYRQQTAVPLLERVLHNEPGRDWLSRLRINYGAGEIISVHTRGYFAFVEFLMRKFAHFATYFLLSSFLFVYLDQHVQPRWLQFLLTPLAVGGLAALDEWHQLFTGDRSPEVQDVILDMTGALVAVIVICAWRWFRRRKKSPSA